VSSLRLVLLLLLPKLRGLTRLGASREQRHPLRLLFFSGLGLAFAAGIYAGSLWFLRHIMEVELVGALLPRKLLALVMLILMLVLLLSAAIGSFSVFFLSDDLPLLLAAPLPAGPLYFARYLEMMLASSWMVVFFGLPVFLAYGRAFAAGPEYYLGLALLFPAALVIPGCLGAILAAVLTRLFSARRSRDLLIVLVLVLFVVLYLLFRALRPERLLSEESFGTMVEFLRLFETTESGWLPSEWAAEALFALLNGRALPVLSALAVVTGALASLALMGWVGVPLFPAGAALAQEGRLRRGAGIAPSRQRWLGTWLDRLFGSSAGPMRAIVLKDIRIFFRDPNQWLQVLLLAALAAVYLLNFAYLKLAQFSWFTLYTVNHVLIGLVLSGVAVRFVFPVVSLEGRAYWFIQSAPLPRRAFLHAKLLGAFAPLAIMGLVLSLISCVVIEVPAVFLVLSAALVLPLSLSIAALGVGIGAVYPRFTAENAAKIPTGVGGVVFMIASAACSLLFLLATFYPTFALYELPRRLHRPVARPDWLVASLLAAAGIGVLVPLLAMALGRWRLERRED